MIKELRDVLTVRQVVERTGLSEKKVRWLIRTGKLPASRVGYNLFVTVRDAAKLAKTQAA